MPAEFKYEIVETLGVLSETPKGWTKELNKMLRRQGLCKEARYLANQRYNKWQKQKPRKTRKAFPKRL